jgi:uncharacterized membrane protein
MWSGNRSVDAMHFPNNDDTSMADTRLKALTHPPFNEGPPARPKLANGLGWLSIALGLAEILAPRALARLIGVRHHPVLFAALGLREITSGLGILSQRRPAGWLWSRVAGDVMDLSLLGTAFVSEDAEDHRVEAAAAAVAGVTVLDAMCAWQHSRVSAPIRVIRTIAIDRTPAELYRFWRQLENLPRFMRHLEEVRVETETQSHWIACAPAGKTVEWDAEIVDDRPDRLIAWRSLPGSGIENSGVVRFDDAPGGRGTFVHVDLAYRPPGGVVGALVAKWFGEEPSQQVQSDLYRLKQLIETGQVSTTEGQSAARPNSTSKLYDTEHVTG